MTRCEFVYGMTCKEMSKRFMELKDENEALRKLAEGLCSMLPSVPERCHNCAFVVECHSQCQDGRCYLSEYMTELGV